MSYVVLARKYRPRSFAQMVGQEHVVQALTNALQQQRLHHAYLFTGTRGIGKTTVSRILAKSLNCTGADGHGGITAEPCGVCGACTEIDADRYIDYIELDAASNRGIDEIRDMIERAAYKPGIGRFKVFMIDEAHMLTKEAFNALLKTLEEPPAYLKFVLATTDPDKLLPTVLSRCLQFNLRPMAPVTVREHLARVLAAEGVAADAGSLRLLARAARGSMRDGLSLTDQAIAYGGGRLTEDGVRAMLGSVDRGQARAIVEALSRRDGPALLAAVDGLRGLGLSAAATLEEIALLLQQMAVEQAVPGALDEEDPEAADARELAPTLAPDETQLLYSMALHGRAELGLMSDEYGALTMVLLRFLAFPAQPAAAPARPAPPARALPLRAPAPPATRLAAAPAPATHLAAAPVPAAAYEQGERWNQLVGKLCEQGRLAALLRELATQAGLRAIDEGFTPPRWHLVVEREPLRSGALADKLAAVLAAELGHPLQIELEAGVPADSPARRDAAERQRRQTAAEQAIHNDPVVRELLSQFKGARIVPGSIKPT
jgi:DNA polymerase-3 subunit gamma/tau